MGKFQLFMHVFCTLQRRTTTLFFVFVLLTVIYLSPAFPLNVYRGRGHVPRRSVRNHARAPFHLFSLNTFIVSPLSSWRREDSKGLRWCGPACPRERFFSGRR